VRGISTFLVLFLLVFAAPLYAQEFTGNVNGRVNDDTGAVIPGVNVTLRSPAMQGERAAVSDESGGYRFILLAPGTYSVTFELPGFRSVIREGVVVEVGRTTTINVSLQVATLAEAVTVTGESPVVDVQNATVAVNFNQTMLRDLPNSRDLWVVLAQTPGVATTRFDVGGSTMGTQTGFRSFGFNGQNWVNLDGIVTNEGTAAAGFYMDYGAFQEIQVSAAANSAEVPVPGAFINTVIKTGSNDLKGEVYFDWEDNSFQGNNVTPALEDRGITAGDKFVRYNDFNFQLGGPLKKDKLWWFYSQRDQFASLRTELRQNDGTPGGLFTTRLWNYTIKMNYQVNQTNSIIFTGQAGRKVQPYREGQGTTAQFYNVDSTGYQKHWSWAYKGQWTSVINSRTTFDLSGNTYGYHFPIRNRVDETPTRDTTTSIVRGGYSGGGTGTTTGTPFRHQRRRWHFNANLSFFKENFAGGNHDFKAGYGLNYEDQRYLYKGVPGSPGTLGNIVLYYDNGRPDRFQIQNTPFRYWNALMQNFFFIQDKWQIGRRLTLNVGFRFDRYGSYIPAQGNPGTGPFATKTEISKIDLPNFNNPVPRIAFVYDVFGNTKTAIKGSWGRYSENTGVTLASAANANSSPITTRYSWDGRPASQITPAYIATLGAPLTISGQAAPIEVNPNLKNQYTDEYTAGFDHQLLNNLGIHASWVRKLRYKWWDTINQAEKFTDYAPVDAIDFGLDGVKGTPDDKPFTIFERTVAAAVSQYLTNWDAGDNYTTFEFGATKRFSNKWQMITGFDWTKRNLKGNITNDPNGHLYGADSDEHTKLWTYKLSGSYLLPRGVQFSATYNAQKGENYGRRQSFNAATLVRGTALRQGTVTAYVEPDGAYYRPTAHLVNLRAEKSFKITESQKITSIFDLFNIQNANTVVGIDDLTGTVRDAKGNNVPRFGRYTQIINPRIFRLGVRYMF